MTDDAPDTYTPILWATLGKEAQYDEYIRVRQAFSDLTARLAAVEAERDQLKEQRRQLHDELSYRDLQASGGLPEAASLSDALQACPRCATLGNVYPDRQSTKETA